MTGVRPRRVMKRFLQTTSLHGFKYMSTSHHLDRWVWACWSAVCACAAGALLAVLLARFVSAPLLLARGALPAPGPGRGRLAQYSQRAPPLVAVCPSPYRAAQLLADKFSINLTDAKWLPILFSNILRGKPADDQQRILLDSLLDAHNVSLSEALMDFIAPCKEMMRRCQWQKSLVPCNRLFAKELTRWGACCVMRAERLMELTTLSEYLETTERLDMMMDCYVKRNFDSYCCEFFIKYRGEEWLGPWYLMSGYAYSAQLVTTSIQDPVKDKLVNGTCVSAPLYSFSRCMIACKETECGCSHPLRLKEEFEIELPPPCSIMRMKCLGNFIRSEDIPCNCLPACQRITAYMSMESIRISEAIQSYNPIFEGVNSNSTIVLSINIRMRGSKSYDLLPTESWLTLLSSLGGVFNMFLGVGLFSVLECLFLLLRLPLSLRNNSTFSAR